MSKIAEKRALEAYPVKMVDGPIGYEDSIFDFNAFCRYIFQEGYEQAEKDIEALILKYLDSRNERDYATVGWIKRNFGKYKKEIMEEE